MDDGPIVKLFEARVALFYSMILSNNKNIILQNPIINILELSNQLFVQLNVHYVGIPVCVMKRLDFRKYLDSDCSNRTKYEERFAREEVRIGTEL